MAVPAALPPFAATPMKHLRFLSVALAALASAPAHAQRESAEPSAEVRSAIIRLFDGMRAGDSAVVRVAFHPAARLQSVGSNREGVIALRTDSLGAFLNAVGAPGHPEWDERIANLVVQVDGDLAQAWMNYTFYLGGRKSHCGVNALQLFRTAEGWKIIQIVDTRRRSECPDLPRGSTG